MTNPEDFIPATNVAELTRRSSAASVAAGELAETMTADLPLARRTALHALLSAGGRVGVEITTDAKANCRTCLIAFDREGGRYALATVTTIGQDVGVAH